MPSPIESPRRTPPKASLLLRQTPALTVSVKEIMFRVNLTVPLRLFRTKTKPLLLGCFVFVRAKPLLLGCFVFVRGFAASGDKVVALLRLDLTHHPPIRMTFRGLEIDNNHAVILYFHYSSFPQGSRFADKGRENR